jgi:hypothetical protein
MKNFFCKEKLNKNYFYFTEKNKPKKELFSLQR